MFAIRRTLFEMDPECGHLDKTETIGKSTSGASSSESEYGASTTTTTTTTSTNQLISDDDNTNAAPDKAKKRRHSTPTQDEEGNDEPEFDDLCAKRKAPNDFYDLSNLLNLSDEVLLNILKYLNSISLEQLGL